MSKRAISHTEITTAFDCFARWDFTYGGHLTGGDVLKRKVAAVRLREGRAWGRAVAELHAPDFRLPLRVRYSRALRALWFALDEDAASQREHGFYDPTEHHDMALRLAGILWHYAQTSEPLAITDPEFELRVPLPSRTGRGRSNRYLFHGYLDGLAEIDGRLWIVEYKLRDRLTDLAQVALGRQYRRYAWAAEQVIERPIAGVIVDERLNKAPKPARWVKGKRKAEGLVPSHEKKQLTTRELYEEACARAGVDVDQATAAALDQRRWQVRHRVIFRRSEIEEAGKELVAAAQVVAQLDNAVLFPVRNPSPQRCNDCPFREVCPNPDDRELVDLEFERRPPKRLRIAEEA